MFTLTESQAILAALPTTFDSHDFIRVGALIYTPSFLNMIRQYRGDFTIIDSQIGQELQKNAGSLQIRKKNEAETETETIIGTMSKCAAWEKINN